MSSVQWPEGEEDMDPGMLTDDEIVELILGRKFVLEEQLSSWLMA